MNYCFNYYCRLIHSGKSLVLICTQSKTKGRGTRCFLINPNGAKIIQGMKRKQTPEEIITSLLQEEDSKEEYVRKDFFRYVETLKRYEILSDNLILQ